MKILKSLLLGFAALIGLSSCQSGENGSYYESFYDIDLNTKERDATFNFIAKPQGNGSYMVMLVFYTENLNTEDRIIKYNDSTDKETFTITTITDLENNVIHTEQSNIKLEAFADKEGKMDALLAFIKSLNKDQTYKIRVEMKNLDKYPLKDIKAKLAFGRGRSVVNK